MVWQAGQSLYRNRYTVQGKLGSGGFGITYLVKDGKGREWVVKTLKDEVMTNEEYADYRDKYLRDFKDEAFRLAICRHRHIVQIENSFTHQDFPCILMEYIQGIDLWQRLKKQGALSEAEAVRYIRQIGEALIVVHDKGLLHRDLKPHNIMVRPTQDEAVLIDFGIAREFISDLTQTHSIALTPGFAPIEQYDEQGHRGEYTDVYALAATFVTLITGSPPPPSFMRAVRDRFQVPTGVSAAVQKAIQEGMAVQPEERTQTVEDWLDLLQVSTPSFGGMQKQELRFDLGQDTSLELVQIPAGKFMMGSNDYDNEKPIHEVTVPAFLMGKYPVTNAQWEAVMGTKPSEKYDIKFQDKNQPVIGVSWGDCQEFCKKLSAKIRKEFRLPSEAEWEYACRGGTQTKYYFGDEAGELGKYAWYGDNSGTQILDSDRLWRENYGEYWQRLTDNKNSTHPVGEKIPNVWGLYDMHGNVWEWCSDIYHENYTDVPADGSSWETGTVKNYRAHRGSSWYLFAACCRSASRLGSSADNRYNVIGFRLVVA